MAGKQTFEKVRTNKAYAEGRTARFTGKLAGDNPWPVAFEEETAAWALGFAAPNGDLDDTCYSGLTSPFSLPTPGSLTPGSSPGTGVKEPDTNPLNKWPKGSLKHLLDSMGIAYPADATISDLVALVPDTHQHHLAEEIPTPTWTNTRIVQWLEKEGADVPDALKDDKDALSEMVHDIIELKAGIPLDPGFLYQ